MTRFLLLIVVLALAWTGWLHHRASQEMAAWVTALRPHLLLRYDGLRAWPGQAVQLHGVTLEPTGSWRAGLALPVGYRLHAERMTLGQADAASGEQRIDLEGVRAPVDSLPTALRAPLQRADLEALTGSLQLVKQPPLGGLPWQWTVIWHGNEGLAAYLSSRFIAGPDFPALSLNGTSLVDATLTVEETGLLSRLRRSEALAAGRTANAWAELTLQQLQTAAVEADWKLPDHLTTTLERGLREPQSFSLRLSPPVPVRLDQINLYAADDRWALLGFSAELANLSTGSR